MQEETIPVGRKVTIGDYIEFIKRHLEAGGVIEHFYDRPMPDNIYFVSEDCFIPPKYGVGSFTVIVASGVQVYGGNEFGHNIVHELSHLPSNMVALYNNINVPSKYVPEINELWLLEDKLTAAFSALGACVCGTDDEKEKAENAFMECQKDFQAAHDKHKESQKLLVVNEPRKDSAIDTAKALTTGDRQEQYGHPMENFTQIASILSGILHKKLTKPLDYQDVALIMIGVKIGRQQHKHSDDNIVDGIGYWNTLAMCKEVELDGILSLPVRAKEPFKKSN